MNKVLITDRVHPLLINGLQAQSFICDYRPEIPLVETQSIIHNYVGIVINTKTKMDKSMLDLAINLKFIARLGSGLDIIDLKHAKKNEISVLRSPEGNRNAVAEHALGMLLALTNNLLRSDHEIRKGLWNREKNRGIEVRGLTVGLIGYGNTGQQFAKVLEGLGVQRQYFDPYRRRLDSDNRFVEEVSLDVLMETSDIISFHVPLTEQTRNMCNAAFLKSCKKGVIIINTSRGKVIKLSDLNTALKSTQVGGACLDVFENEKPETFTNEERNSFSALSLMDNVVLSPHIAGWTHESKRKIAEVLLNKILAVMHTK